jgi:hypothetical protein
MSNGERKGPNARAARLEAELRANLKKRKEQTRARARAAAPVADIPEETDKASREEAGGEE